MPPSARIVTRREQAADQVGLPLPRCFGTRQAYPVMNVRGRFAQSRRSGTETRHGWRWSQQGLLGRFPHCLRHCPARVRCCAWPCAALLLRSAATIRHRFSDGDNSTRTKNPANPIDIVGNTMWEGDGEGKLRPEQQHWIERHRISLRGDTGSLRSMTSIAPWLWSRRITL